MIRLGLLLLASVLAFDAHGAKFLEIATDKASYLAGETAHIRVHVVSPPESPSYDYFLKGTLGTDEFALEKITDTEFFIDAVALTAGEKDFSVETFLEDRQLAAALNDAIFSYGVQIKHIQDALLVADPADVPALNEELAVQQARYSDASEKLNGIRRHIDGPTTIHFQVN